MPNTVSLSDSEINRLVSILSEYQMQTGKSVEDLLETFQEYEREPEKVYSTSMRPPDDGDEGESSWESETRE
ncbi:hypothetical protein [Haladaptatus caseinilyticus]|uniref:hypothetical protein n=1 Tax=Haladaptatus caseinilyticus TaxID=2993314 RepID=UPI00224B61F0|nr:hypothetical protein [Haladaptatus caseinilyticus]